MTSQLHLVTGATGFIGKRLARVLIEDNLPCRLVARKRKANQTIVQPVDLHNKVQLANICSGVDIIFHCAGYAHAFSASLASEEKIHWSVNFEGTRNLVEAAGAAGVRSFVFLSWVKAMADPGRCCADEEFPGNPETAYGQAKRAAEEAVNDAGRKYGMQVVNLRLTMVYGFGGHGNLERMARFMSKGWFPPLPETRNRRSLVHVDDVVAAMRLVAIDPRANGRTYILAGPEAPSGGKLFDELRLALGLSPCSWRVPQWSLKCAASLGDALQSYLGRRMLFNNEILTRLLGSAWYSSNRIEQELGWRAKISLREGLREMCGK